MNFMRLRPVSSLLFLQNFLPLTVEGKVTDDSCSDGIQLCVSKAIGRFRTALNSRFPTCTHEDSPFHPFTLRPQHCIIAFTGDGLVSVPEPKLSLDILYRCSCVRSGGETFIRPEGPSAVQPLSQSRFNWYIFFSSIYFFGNQYIQRVKRKIVS